MCWQLPGSTYLYMHIIIYDIISNQNNFEGKEEMGGEGEALFPASSPCSSAVPEGKL